MPTANDSPAGEHDLGLQRSRAWSLLAAAVFIVGAGALVVWSAHHPDPLPTEERTVSASTPVDEPIYLGVANGFNGRTLELSGVKVHATSNTDISITPLLCRDGRIEATTEPESFCSALVNPEGQTLRAEDSIVLQVTSDEPAIAVIDPVRLGFRDGLRWGTFPTGADAVVRVLTR